MLMMVSEFAQNINESTRSLSPGIEKISICPVFSKLPLKQPNNFPQQPIMTQNPPCNRLTTVQTSNIERPDPREMHHEIDCNQIKPLKRELNHLLLKIIVK